jgi:uncharacterized protein YbaP (TraB family)
MTHHPILNAGNFARLCAAMAAMTLCISGWSQRHYQSLFWTVTDPQTGKASYLYGTMHMSTKVVFHLGEPFYNAIESSDVVALELEPEAWLDDLFVDEDIREEFRSGGIGNEDQSPQFAPPPLAEKLTLRTSLQDRIRSVLMYDPELLNYLLFRYDEYGRQEDFEENTWLDMHIYQTGKKLGKATMGLETFTQSSHFLKLAEKAEQEEPGQNDNNWEGRSQQMKLQEQLEPAYRRQDLDLIDSINHYTTSKGFMKYILVERNKVFVQAIDSVMRQGKSIFAGMGCAHLPGGEGVIEMLRARGYKVEPADKGGRDARRREKLESTVLKRTYAPFNTNDGSLNFSTPSKVYTFSSGNDGAVWLSMDIPNGGTFLVYKLRSYGALRGLAREQMMQSIDSMVYESVAGTIVSQKRFTFQGYPALDIVNKTRRGDYQRKWLIVTDNELLVLKINATGEKVKEGYGSEFFTSFKIHSPPAKSWQSADGVLRYRGKLDLTDYAMNAFFSMGSDEMEAAAAQPNGDFYMVRRLRVADPGFMDEDRYEMNRILDAFASQNDLRTTVIQTLSVQGRDALYTGMTGWNTRPMYVMSLIENLHYYCFIASCASEEDALAFFRSFQWGDASYGDFTLQTDTTGCFQVSLPFVHKPEEINTFWLRGKRKTTTDADDFSYSCTLKPDDRSDVVQVKMTRSGIYSFERDSLDYMNELMQEATGNGDLVVKALEEKCTPTGFVRHYTLGDSATYRRKWVKHILHHSTLYTLQSSFDSIAGPGKFVREVFQTFAPTDTMNRRSLFYPSGKRYLEDLFSADSLVQERAFGQLQRASLTKEDCPLIRQKMKMIQHLPESKRGDVKDFLAYHLWRDNSDENVRFLRYEYLTNTDSAGYQLTVLDAMASASTTFAITTLKQLLLEDPPIASLQTNANPLSSVTDSLELARQLFPDLLRLTSLDEYKADVYKLLALLTDSGQVKKGMLKNELAETVLAARTEFKRINNAENLNYNAITRLLNYLSVLYPYRDQTEVAALFQRMFESRKEDLLLDYFVFLSERSIQLPDSIVKKIAVKNEDNILTYYYALKNVDRLDQFPCDWRDRELLLRLHAVRQYAEEENLDSVVFIPAEALSIRGRNFNVYRIKLRETEAAPWRGAWIALGEDKNNRPLPEEILESGSSFALEGSKDEDEVYRKELKKFIERNRFQRNGSNNFDSYYMDW